MPKAPSRPCTRTGCRHNQPCPDHKGRTVYQEQRGSAAQRGYDAKWKKYRDWFVRQAECSICGQNHIVCADCLKENVFTAAYAVDHIVPHRGDLTLLWDHKNLQSLCARHHGIKSQKERQFGPELAL
jgi:5-methylcytosine-specific restriction protein A